MSYYDPDEFDPNMGKEPWWTFFLFALGVATLVAISNYSLLF